MVIKSRKMKWAGAFTSWGEIKMHTKFWLNNLKKGVEDVCMWKDNIKTDLKEIGLEDFNWIHVAKDRDQRQALVSTVMNLWVQ
jgi:hypothetical protein